MTDTQWPSYTIFKQDRPNKPHESIGAVHAVDAEMALQNGRDVFVRRPSAVSLWVVPTAAIFSKTAAELETDNAWQQAINRNDTTETYAVFQKKTERRGMAFTTYIGEVEAASPEHALEVALETFTEGKPFVWWVVPAQAISKSEEENHESMFRPANEKIFRMPNQYRTVFSMQKIKRET